MAPHDEAENMLYEAGCELVEAAGGIARVAAEPGAARAVPALLGCLETALDELERACRTLHDRSRCTASDPTAHDPLGRAYANLAVALQDATDASRTARSLAAASHHRV